MREVEAAADARRRRRGRWRSPSTTTAWPAAVAAMAAALGGMDALAFTGGVGEGSGRTRAEAARRLAFLGVAVDPGRNTGVKRDADVSAPGARVRTLVVGAREELVIARAVRRAVGCAPTRGMT